MLQPMYHLFLHQHLLGETNVWRTTMSEWGKHSKSHASPGYGYGLPYGTPGGGMPPYTPPPLGRQDDGERTSSCSNG